MLSPEKAMQVQRDLGSDIVMIFDEVRLTLRRKKKRKTQWN